MSLDINKNLQEDQSILTLSLIGRLDTTSYTIFAKELDEILSPNFNIKTLILDFKDVDYISSAGLREILRAQKGLNKKGSNMKLINVCQNVLEVFTITGFVDFLTIE